MHQKFYVGTYDDYIHSNNPQNKPIKNGQNRIEYWLYFFHLETVIKLQRRLENEKTHNCFNLWILCMFYFANNILI